MKNFISLTVATWFGVGLVAPFARSFWGSLFALPLCWFLVHRAKLIHEQAPFDPNVWFIYLFWTAIIFVIGILSIPRAKIRLKKDWQGKTRIFYKNEIVIDKVVGLLITCLPLTVIQFTSWWLTLALALIFFLLLDKIKLWPARIFYQSYDPFDVMLTSIISGLYAAVCLVLTLKYIF